MAEVDISPLAKRLAEENNVNWRLLRGTGDNGKVIERDVLDYLARVMAGEEDLDPTPEPLPPGLNAWTDGEELGTDDVPAAAPPAGDRPSSEPPERSDPDAVAGTGKSRDTVWADGEDSLFEPESESGLGASEHRGGDPLQDWSAPGRSEGSQPSGALSGGEVDLDEPEIDEEIFVFDDEPAPIEGGSDSSDDAGWADDVGSFGERSGESDHSDFVDDDFFSIREPGPTDPEPAGQIGLAWDDEDAYDHDEGTSGEEGGGASGYEPILGQEADSPSGPDASSVIGQEDSAWGREAYGASEGGVHAGAGDEHSWEELRNPEAGRAESQSNDQSHWEDDDDQEWGFTATGTSRGDDVDPTRDPREFQSPEGVRLEEEETHLSPLLGAGAPGELERDERRTPGSSTANVGTPSMDRGATGAGFGRAPGATVIVRREVELSALVRAQAGVAQELGLPELPPVGFLLRAAIRGAEPWPLTTSAGSFVALALLDGTGVDLVEVAEAATMPFRDLVAACESARPGGVLRDGTALAVADLSTLDIDEAVLDLGVPVLTLGRIRTRANGRRHVGTLSLSGAQSPVAAANFLTRVTELLNSPVRLLL